MKCLIAKDGELKERVEIHCHVTAMAPLSRSLILWLLHPILLPTIAISISSLALLIYTLLELSPRPFVLH